MIVFFILVFQRQTVGEKRKKSEKHDEDKNSDKGIIEFPEERMKQPKSKTS